MLLPLLLLAVLPHRGTSADMSQDAAKGAGLLRGCQAEMRLIDADALNTADQGDLVSGSYCIGYVNGFIANFTTPSSSICTNNQPVVELVRTYVAYMGTHPRLLDEDKRLGLRLALEDGFPCTISSDSVDAQVRVRRNRL